jgi:hypothetical protein
MISLIVDVAEKLLTDFTPPITFLNLPAEFAQRLARMPVF